MSTTIMLFTILVTHASSPAIRAEDHIEQANRCLRVDDFGCARRQAARALAIPGEHDQEAGFLLGLAWQLDGHPTDALAFYRQALASQPYGRFTDQLEFHIAETLYETGRAREGLKWLRKAKRGRSLDAGDTAKFAINEGMMRLSLGQQRRGTKRLLDVLERTPTYYATLHQARARTLLVHRWLDVADALGTSDPVLLDRRAFLISASRDQLMKTIDNDHPDYTLQQLLRIGQSYERLGDDVVTDYGTPADVPVDERYKVRNTWKKAARFYDMGKRHAEARSGSHVTVFEDAEHLLTSKQGLLPD